MNDLNSWGRNVYFSKPLESITEAAEKGVGTAPKGRLCGWLTPRPRVGDLFTCDMKSGRVAVLRVTKMDTYVDPPDMFYADVVFDGYADQEEQKSRIASAEKPRHRPWWMNA
ncbi:hypothetical protein SEA_REDWATTLEHOG_120 [Gordonia phage RedWattleHog]|nr:hypothetical protein SEA_REDWATTLEHOG_120 [Gordonia phage RedWattleHog]